MLGSARAFKDAIYEQLARVGKAVASPRRLEILELLAQAPRTVEALAREAGLSVANASQHLKVLRQARLVDADKQGLYVTCRLADETVEDFLRTLRGLAEARFAEVERIARDFLEDREGLEPVDRKTLLARMRKGEVTVLDVRPAEEYRFGHIRGARSIPLPELERRLSELPRGREVVAYCRGPYCVMAIKAVATLRRRGYRAARLAEGVPEWKALGLPVEASAEGG